MDRRASGKQSRPSGNQRTEGQRMYTASPSSRGKERAALRRRRKRRQTILFYVFLFFLVITAAVVLSFTVLFRMETISVTGSSPYTQEEIIEASGLKKGENLFRLDLEKAESLLESGLPYIGKAQISRKLPDSVVIHVEMAETAGAVEYSGQVALIDSSGKVLEIRSDIPEGCPAIKGVDISQAQPGQALVYKDTEKKENLELLMQAMESTGLSSVTELDLDDPFNLIAVYQGRIRLELGVATDLTEKIRFFKDGILPSGQITENMRGTLDLSLVPKTNKAYFSEELTSSQSETPVSSQPEESSSASGGEEASSSQGSASSEQTTS